MYMYMSVIFSLILPTLFFILHIQLYIALNYFWNNTVHRYILYFFSSVAQSCLTLCDPMDCSTPGFPVLHQLPELAQSQVHQGSDVIQPSHPLSSPSPPAFNLSQHQGLFQWEIWLYFLRSIKTLKSEN